MLATLGVAQEAALLVLAAHGLAANAVQNAAAVLAPLDRAEGDHLEFVAVGRCTAGGAVVVAARGSARCLSIRSAVRLLLMAQISIKLA